MTPLIACYFISSMPTMLIYVNIKIIGQISHFGHQGLGVGGGGGLNMGEYSMKGRNIKQIMLHDPGEWAGVRLCAWIVC